MDDLAGDPLLLLSLCSSCEHYCFLILKTCGLQGNVLFVAHTMVVVLLLGVGGERKDTPGRREVRGGARARRRQTGSTDSGRWSTEAIVKNSLGAARSAADARAHHGRCRGRCGRRLVIIIIFGVRCADGCGRRCVELVDDRFVKTDGAGDNDFPGCGHEDVPPDLMAGDAEVPPDVAYGPELAVALVLFYQAVRAAAKLPEAGMVGLGFGNQLIWRGTALIFKARGAVHDPHCQVEGVRPVLRWNARLVVHGAHNAEDAPEGGLGDRVHLRVIRD